MTEDCKCTHLLKLNNVMLDMSINLPHYKLKMCPSVIDAAMETCLMATTWTYIAVKSSTWTFRIIKKTFIFYYGNQQKQVRALKL